MKLKDIVLIGLFVLPSLSAARTDFRPGFIVKTEGDTIFGEIDYYKSNQNLSESCRFRESPMDYVMVYFPDEVKTIRFDDGPCYVTSTSDGNTFFMQKLVEGRVRLYCVEYDDSTNFYLNKGGMSLTRIPYSEEYTTLDGRDYLHKSQKHLGLYSYFMSDAPEIQPRIATMGKPEKKSLIGLVTSYNNMVAKDSACIVYRDEFSLTPDIEVLGGISSFTSKDVKGNNKFQIGALLHFPLQKVNRFTFLRTGLLYSYIDDVQKPVVRIPVQIEHFYSKWNIVPKVGFGLNIYPNYKSVTLAFMAGVQAKLYKSFYWSLVYDVDLIQSEKLDGPRIKHSLLPNKLYSQNLLIGLYYKF